MEKSETISTANIDAFLSVAWKLFEANERDRGFKMALGLVTKQETEFGQYTLARMQKELGHRNAAIAALDRALEINPDDLDSRLLLASELLEEEDFSRAKRELETALSQNPFSPQCHLITARLEVALGRPNNALKRLERSINFAPGACQLRLEQLKILVLLKREKEAEEAFRKLNQVCHDRDSRQAATDILKGKY